MAQRKMRAPPRRTAPEREAQTTNFSLVPPARTVGAGLARYRGVTLRRCLGAFRWRRGPCVWASPQTRVDGEELRPALEYLNRSAGNSFFRNVSSGPTRWGSLESMSRAGDVC